jgi:hypothetical protein
MMFVKTKQCVIHDKDQVVEPTDVCGYWVGGAPMDEWMDHPGIEPVETRFSGLNPAPAEGTKCYNCKFFQGFSKSMGKCKQITSDQEVGNLAQVHANGCCAAWKEKKIASAQEFSLYLQKIKSEGD